MTEQIPIFRQLDLLGARFGSVGSPVTQGDHSTMRWPELFTLQIQIQIQTQIQVQIFIWFGKHCQPRRPFNNVAGQTCPLYQVESLDLQGALQSRRKCGWLVTKGWWRDYAPEFSPEQD